MSQKKQSIAARYAMLALLFAFLLFTQSCRKNNLDDITATDNEDYSGWGEASHGNSVSPDYNTVFAQNTVLRFDVKISADDWVSMKNSKHPEAPII